MLLLGRADNTCHARLGYLVHVCVQLDRLVERGRRLVVYRQQTHVDVHGHSGRPLLTSLRRSVGFSRRRLRDSPGLRRWARRLLKLLISGIEVDSGEAQALLLLVVEHVCSTRHIVAASHDGPLGDLA